MWDGGSRIGLSSIAPLLTTRQKEVRGATCKGRALNRLAMALEEPRPQDKAELMEKLEFLAPISAKAGLEKLDGALWHAYRRGWARSRKHLPVADVAAVGGWGDIGTLLKCYTQADSDTMLAVMESPKKISEKAVSR